MNTARGDLLQRINACMVRDAARLRARLAAIAKNRVPAAIADFYATLERCEARASERARRVPALHFPEDLPVSRRREEIAAAVQAHQVVVVCGETGSGKTTQLPKICLELGRGVRGQIGHTQPRRIAARSVAARLAEEVGSRPGDLVGYKVRFGDHAGPGALVKVMTDGVLLAEVTGDRLLQAYDTIIVDEAHERSLNIDFLLGYLRTLLSRRPDLKVIITSATIDPERFSRHFGDAPIIRVEGRTYPVEVLYRPPHEEGLDERDEEMQVEIVRAIDEAASYGPGDVLVFLSGEREIRETAESLEKHRFPGGGPTEVLPLFARLSAEEQLRVFRPHEGRRIVLSTNVAETSLTVPGIRSVVDTGVARISRYSPRTKVQRLEVEAVSRASADQRLGRCGRLGPGVCVRLYSEDDYAARPQFTDPEILRTNLASVILQMLSLGLGSIDEFPFIDPPDSRMIKDGYETLAEIGAVDADKKITPLGRELSRLPIDPRFGRMLLAARDEPGCCLADVLVIVAGLSVQDPRERPLEKQAQADEAHGAFRDATSDFLSMLRLWDWYHERAGVLTSGKLRRACRDSFVSFVRLREWEDIHRQLVELLVEAHEAPRGRRDWEKHPPLPPAPQGTEKPDAATKRRVEAIHRALLSGLLSNVGLKGESGEYSGVRGLKFSIFPGSALFKNGPRWIMGAELVRTARLYARACAPTDPASIEHAAAHLVSKSHSDPHWDARSGRVMAFERVSLFGLDLVVRRRVHYAPVNLPVAREIFIRDALVEGAMLTDAPFFDHNHGLVRQVRDMEARSRRAHLLADPIRRFEFYDQRLPPTVASAHDLNEWLRTRKGADRDVLHMSVEHVLEPGAALPRRDDFPDALEFGSAILPLEYRLEPGQPTDGVTIRVPLEAITSISSERLHWLVPGHLREKVETLLKGLLKDVRRLLPPAGEAADACLPLLTFGEGSLFEQLRRAVRTRFGVDVPRDALERAPLPDFLRMRVEVIDADGRVLAADRDLGQIRAALASFMRAQAVGEIARGAEAFNRDGLTTWDFGDLPERVEIERYGTIFVAYPGLVDRLTSVSLRLFDHAENAARESRAGLRRLFMLDAEGEVRRATHRHPDVERLSALAAILGDPRVFRAAFNELVVERALGSTQRLPRTKDEFTGASRRAVSNLGASVRECADACELVLRGAQAVLSRLSGRVPAAWSESVEDMRGQLAAMLPPNFPIATPWDSLRHLPRYLAAIDLRLQRLAGQGVARDIQRMREVMPIWRGYLELTKRERELGLDPARVREFRWLVEELRVSLFAQELRTPVPVSVRRLHEAWEAIVKV
ncbi:MAG: ATP-dependent RNA helicase HrpA [Planctomycetota bacterium]|nr:ATP-dependent RNA helicase HrpA [Planctomycetota bacterium]